MHLLASLPHRLDGLHVVLDCAHGAASGVSPETFRDAGARVTVIGADPDGLNINDGVGSTHLDSLAKEVVRHGADIGIAHDGDADRCLAVDSRGRIVDGDQIMAILAVSMKDRGHLVDDTLVATVMSNLGLHRAMAEQGITVVQTAVGDRYVLEAMNEGGFSLGGEQSGHVIMSEYATTGDGLLTGLHLMAEMARQDKTLAAARVDHDRVPAGARERSQRRPHAGIHRRGPGGCRGRGGRGARRFRARAAAPFGHRGDGARHGRGR